MDWYCSCLDARVSKRGELCADVSAQVRRCSVVSIPATSLVKFESTSPNDMSKQWSNNPGDAAMDSLLSLLTACSKHVVML
jgi:hypothetical protein